MTTTTTSNIEELEAAHRDAEAVVNELLQEAADIPRKLAEAEAEDHRENAAAHERAVDQGVKASQRPAPTWPQFGKVRQREDRLPKLILQARHGAAMAACDLWGARARVEREKVSGRIEYLTETRDSLKADLKDAEDELHRIAGAGRSENTRHYESKREVNRLAIQLKQVGLSAQMR